MTGSGKSSPQEWEPRSVNTEMSSYYDEDPKKNNTVMNSLDI